MRLAALQPRRACCCCCCQPTSTRTAPGRHSHLLAVGHSHLLTQDLSHLLIRSSAKASRSFRPSPAPLLLALLPPLALLLPLLMLPLSASATKLLLLDSTPAGKHPGAEAASGSLRLLLLLLRLCALLLLPALRERLRDLRLLPRPDEDWDSLLCRPRLNLRSRLPAPVAVLLLGLGRGVLSPLLLALLAPLRVRPWLSRGAGSEWVASLPPACCCCCRVVAEGSSVPAPAVAAPAAAPRELLLLLVDDSLDGSAACCWCCCCWWSAARRGVVGGCWESSEAASPDAAAASSCCCCWRSGRGGRAGCCPVLLPRSDGLLVLRRAADTDAQWTAASYAPGPDRVSRLPELGSSQVKVMLSSESSGR